MGQKGSKLPEARILLLGLDNAGKSTLLYKLKHKICVQTSPTVGFNVEMMAVRKNNKNIAITIWDVGGQGPMRQHWQCYHQDTAAIVFVVDSTDRRRFNEAKREIEMTVRSDQLRGRPLIVLANKQDVDNAMTVSEIKSGFNLNRLCPDRDWFVQPCSASTGFGVEEAFTRVVNMIKLPHVTGFKGNIKETVHYLRSGSRY
ncbi:ADP-ribosylation factor-like protein 14 [Eucyclogobius newberryi]|uniref:ADP-ribosylation factor-like protein 14 n=1 Tax=Eucyclogobius newberryi TaxID=166745 RepID=UPI003B5C2813